MQTKTCVYFQQWVLEFCNVWFKNSAQLNYAWAWTALLFRERWSQQITHDGPYSLAYYTRCHNLYQHFCLFSNGLSKQRVVVLLIWLGIQESIIQIGIVGHKCIWWSFFFSFSESDGLKQQLWILWIDMEYRMPQFIICCLYRDRLIKQHMVVHLHWLGIQNATIHIRMFIHIVLVSTNKTLMVLLQLFEIQDSTMYIFILSLYFFLSQQCSFLNCIGLVPKMSKST